MTRAELPQIEDWKCYSPGCRHNSSGPHGNQKFSQDFTKLTLHLVKPSVQYTFPALSFVKVPLICSSPPAADGEHPQQEAMGKTISVWLCVPQHTLKSVSCAGSPSQGVLPSLPSYFNHLTKGVEISARELSCWEYW